MSRNPYLAATRPTSSYTRSSRTSSRRNDLPSIKGSALGRSRSSATLSGLSSGNTSSYTSASSYTPSSSAWQRSLSSTRSGRGANEPSTFSSSYKANEYTPSERKPSRSYESSDSLNQRTTATTSTDRNVVDGSAIESTESVNPDHLKNYQQTKLSQPQAQLRPRSSIQSLNSEESTDTRRSVSSLDATTDHSYADSDSISSSSAPKHLRQGQLLKSRSLEISQIPPDTSSVLTSSMSVDRLLSRSESMTERELRKSYKELVMENEQLRKQLKGIDDLEKQKQQDWIRKERQMQRKISELEEENRQLEQWKQEIQHLKDENSSLIRVVTKLSKKH